MRRLLIAIATFGLGTGTGFAQVTFDGCSDFRGLPVASILNPALPDVAMASLAPNGAPIIQYNPNVLITLSPQTRMFFYAHECAHHALAHMARNIPFRQEQEADCWAIQTLVQRGIFTLQGDVAAVQRDLAFSPGDWTHVPGPQRQFNLQACLR